MPERISETERAQLKILVRKKRKKKPCWSCDESFGIYSFTKTSLKKKNIIHTNFVSYFLLDKN
jgi:hypothetical protein